MVNVLDLKHPQPPAPEPELRPEPIVVEQPDEADLKELVRTPPNFSLGEVEVVEWEARHSLSDRGRYRHYMALAGFMLVGGGVAWWQSSWLSLITIVLGLVAWELHERFGQPVKVRLDERGVSLDGLHYPHAALSSFDIYRMPDGTAELSLATKHWHSPHLRLPLGEIDPHAVRSALGYFVAEKEHPVPLLDRFLRKD